MGGPDYSGVLQAAAGAYQSSLDYAQTTLALQTWQEKLATSLATFGTIATGISAIAKTGSNAAEVLAEPASKCTQNSAKTAKQCTEAINSITS